MSPDHYDPLRFNEAILPVLVREDGSYMSFLPTNEVTGNWTMLLFREPLLLVLLSVVHSLFSLLTCAVSHWQSSAGTLRVRDHATFSGGSVSKLT